MDRQLYNSIIKEHFDITDTQTRKVLVSIDESDQNQVLGNLANKLYNSIVKKVTDIDFGQIPLSKGDITKIPNYTDIVECLTTVRDMMQERRQTTTSVDTIFGAIENLKKYKNLWERSYVLECEIGIVFYNTIALSIVSATSLLISATVEFIKNPDSDVIDLELAKVANSKTKDGLLFKNLEKFNKSCKKGDIEKTFSSILKAQREVREQSEYITNYLKDQGLSESSIENIKGNAVFEDKRGVVMENIATILFTGAMVISLLTCVIPLLHQLTTMLYNLRQSVAEYLSGEADIIRLNAEKVQYNRTKTSEQKKKIIMKQNKIADHFKKWANALMIKSSKAEKDSEAEIKRDKQQKNKLEDVVDEVPGSASIF